MRPLRGCLAVVSLPAVLVGGTVAMVRRSVRVRRRGSTLRARVSRRAGNPARVLCTLGVPSGRVAEVAVALATGVAEAAAAAGLHLGMVTAVPDEDPVLVTVAPRRDLVADRVERSILVGASRLHPHAWLTLSPGTYLAQAVPPFEPFPATPDRLAALVSRGRCRHALLVEIRPGDVEWRVSLTLLAAPAEARSAVNLARRALARLPGWSSG